MRLGRQFSALAGKRGTAGLAETARRAGRGFELGDLSLGHRVSITLESNENGHRRTAVATTALAMAPEHPFRVARCDEADLAAEAPAFEPFAHKVTIPALKPDIHPITGRPSGDRPFVFHLILHILAAVAEVDWLGGQSCPTWSVIQTVSI